jgi:hypothetical protein
VRERSCPELRVGAIMGHAGLERTIFYRHFDDGDLLDAFGREPGISAGTAVEALTEIWVAVIRQRGG